ncbi:MAG: cyclic nucleotide-binding domain-containing protein [Pseudomonadota bacterium]
MIHKKEEPLSPKPGPSPENPVSIHNQKVNEYIRQGDKESAVKLLFELIVHYAGQNQFDKAEAFSEKLMEVDPMALNEIYKSNEIIQAAKTASQDRDHLSSWAELYGTLTTEETNALYYALHKNSIEGDKTLMKQGEKNDRLYLINQGQVKITFDKKEEKLLIKTLNPGDIAGAESFFLPSVNTTSAVTLIPSKFSILKKEVMEKWKTHVPALQHKLQGFCLKKDDISELIKNKKMERRAEQRFRAQGRIVLQLRNPSGNSVGKAFRGELSDVSAHGLSFFIKLANQEIAQRLLGRTLSVQLIPQSTGTEHPPDVVGTVVAIHYQLITDYSIHIKLKKELDIQSIRQLGLLNTTSPVE